MTPKDGRATEGQPGGNGSAPEPTVELTPAELVRLVGVREAAGLTRKEALAAVAAETGVPKSTVYDAVVAAKHAAR